MRLTLSHLFLVIFTLVNIILGCSSDQEDIRFLRGSYQEVFMQAKKEGKGVFVLITDSSCNSCESFINHLNKQITTKKILADSLICYRADISNGSEIEIARLLKCPSFPFPFVFSPAGRLEAFGFPNSAKFDISNLTSIKMDEYLFKELFALPITTDQYRDLITLNVNYALLPKSQTRYRYELINESLNIAAYPYNIREALSIDSGRFTLSNLQSEVLRYSMSPSDEALYGPNSLDSLFSLGVVGDLLKRNSDFVITQDKIDLGVIKLNQVAEFKFTIESMRSKPISIKRIFHPCDCVKFDYNDSTIEPNDKKQVSVSFRPYEIGSFQKKVDVYSKSDGESVESLTFVGNVVR